MSSKAYFSNNSEVIETENRVIEDLLCGLTGVNESVGKQVINSSLVQAWCLAKYGGVSLPRRLIDSKCYNNPLGSYDYDALSHIIERSEYSRERHECRKYRLKPDALARLRAAGDVSERERAAMKKFDFIRGVPLLKQPLGRVSMKGNSIPPLIKDCIKHFNNVGIKVDCNAVRKHLKRLEDAEYEAFNNLSATRSNRVDEEDYRRRRKAHKKAMARFDGDAAHARGLWNWARVEGDFALVKPVHNLKSTGRLYMQLGLQSCTREMRSAALGHDPNHWDYDLKMAHPHILLQFCEDDGITCNALVDFIEKGRKFYAAAAGIDEQLFKKMFASVMMLGELPDYRSDGLDNEYTRNSILRKLHEFYGRTDVDAIRNALKGFSEVTADVRAVIQNWYDDGLTKWIYDITRDGKYVKNDAGMHLSIARLMEMRETKAKRKLGAFRLHGLEQKYNGHLTSLGRQHGYTALLNLHDGLATYFQIPQRARDEAKLLSKFRYANLKETSLYTEK